MCYRANLVVQGQILLANVGVQNDKDVGGRSFTWSVVADAPEIRPHACYPAEFGVAIGQTVSKRML